VKVIDALTWELLVRAIQSLPSAPSWLRELSRLSHEEISRLPKVDNARKGQVASPSVREIVVKEDYLEFLREQIKLNARGSEWTAILETRLKALQPFLGKKTLQATFYKLPNNVTLDINFETGELFHSEISQEP
jgi:hypothetical protein